MADTFDRLLSGSELRRLDDALLRGRPIPKPAAQALTEDEERIWLEQQQAPEAVPVHVTAWRLPPDASIARLTVALAKLVGEARILDIRYRFDNDRGLEKQPGGAPADCVHILPAATRSAFISTLTSGSAAEWDLADKAPVEIRIVLGSGEAALALVRHDILAASYSPERFLADLAGHYGNLDLSPIDGDAGAPEAADRPDAAHADHDAIAALILAEFRQALAAPTMTEHDDFFDHGGHSLVATRVIGRLLGNHGVEVHFNDLFSHPTAAALAQHARRRDTPAQPQATEPKPDTAVTAPLSLAQMSLWKAYAAFGFNEIFNLPFCLEFLDPVDEAAFGEAFRDILVRHPGLRTQFHVRDGKVVQEVVFPEQLDSHKWFWTSAESRGVSRHDEAAHHFDLARELPFRLRFITDEASGRPLLSFLFHHMVLDEWSVNLMMDELAEAYRCRAAGKAPSWPETPRPFHDFAIRQNEKGVSAAELGYWTERLRGAPAGAPVFGVKPQSARDAADPASNAGGWVEIKLERGIVDGLYALARENSASLFNVAYAAIATALHRLSGLDDIVIGTSASARNDADFFDTVGYFTTVVAHRVTFTGGMTLAELIARVKDAINGSLPYTDIPIDLVEESLGMTPGKDHLFEAFIQLHARNKLNGTFTLADGRSVAYRQVDPDRQESLLGLQFEVMEDTIGDDRSIRVMMSYRADHYAPDEVAMLQATIGGIFADFARPGSSAKPL